MPALRTLALASLAAAAAANHLAGPMQDRMNACMAEKCPAFNTFNNAPNFNGFAVSFAQFTAPFMNFNQFGFNMTYVMNVMGYTNNSFTYVDTCLNTASAGSTRPPWCTETTTPVVKTSKPKQNLTDSFACACQHCGASLEAIFQPAGRAVCSLAGQPLPCQTEFDACKAANPSTVTSTGSVSGKDLVYPPIMNTSASSDPCHPEAAVYGYKKGYNLTAVCSSGNTTLAGSSQALALATCVATSRAAAYPTTLNCLDDIGGTSCGVPAAACTPPTCTGSATYGCVPATTATPQSKPAGAATAALSAAAASAVLLAASL